MQEQLNQIEALLKTRTMTHSAICEETGLSTHKVTARLRTLRDTERAHITDWIYTRSGFTAVYVAGKGKDRKNPFPVQKNGKKRKMRLTFSSGLRKSRHLKKWRRSPITVNLTQ